MELAVKLHEALNAGDIETFNTLLKTCSIETVLEFERIYGKTPLERCITLPPEVRFEAMKCLFGSEFVDGSRKNSAGLTAMEVVVNTAQIFAENDFAQATFNEIKRDMISAEIFPLSDEEAFYVMIKRGSLEGFKAFLAIKTDVEEDNRYEHICNALITLSANCIPVDPKLKTYLQWMMSKYSYDRLSENGPKLNPSEWKTHIDVILAAWWHLEQHYDMSGFGSMNDGILRQLKIIHSRLYYLHFYYKNAFRHLPMSEIIFCLAVYLSSFKPPLIRFEPYKLIVNKRSITECLRETCKQLEAAKKALQTIEEKLTVLVERYSRSEDLNDVEKDLISLEHILYQECVSTNPQMQKKWLKHYGSKTKYRFIHSTVNLSNRIKASLKIVNKSMDKNEKSGPQKKNNFQQGKPSIENEDKAKNDLIETVREIVSQESFMFNIFLTKKCRKIYKATRKDYAIAKQLYSISKILQYVNITTSYKTVGSAIHAGALKKLIQVIGEAIKNTKETSNMPTKASNIVNTTLTNTFATICKSHREFFSHGCPMSKIIADEKEDVAIFEKLQKHINMVRAMFQMLLVVTIDSVRQRFYGKAYQCRSIAELRMLFEHVGDMTVLDETQAKNINHVEEYFNHLLIKIVNLKFSASAVRHTQEFPHVVDMLKTRVQVIKELQKFVYSKSEISYCNMVVACRQTDANIATVRRMLTYNLLKKPNRLYEEIVDIWKSCYISLSSIQWREVALIALNPENVTHILKINERRMNNLEHVEYPKLVKSWLQDLKVAESKHEDALKQLGNSRSELHRYLHNVYEVQLKWSYLERYCGKKSAKLAASIEQDTKLLQKMFDDLLGLLKAILQIVGIGSIEDLVEKSIEDIAIVIPALEFYLLEICELLKSVGYFGDNSYLLRKGVPILQGRNLRNSLAHDTLSYNILTDSDEMSLFVNVLAIVEHELDLFQSDRVKQPLTDVGVRSIAKLEMVWIDQHRKMLKALKENNTLAAFHTVRSGYDLQLSLFTPERSPQKEAIFQARVDVRELHDPLIALLDGYIEGFFTTIISPTFLSYVALGEADYATALTRALEIREQTFNPDELYGWPNLIDGLRTKDVLSQFLSPAKGWDNLQQLVQYGNAQAVRQFITQVDISTLIKHPDTKYGVNPLSTGVIHGTENVCEVLADVCNIQQRTEAICYAIKIRWHKMFERLMETTAVRNYDPLLNMALVSNNMVAANYLYGKIYPSSRTSSSSIQLSAMTKVTLERSLKAYSRTELLKFCLAHNLVPVDTNSGPIWNNLLYCAIRNQNSSSVQYIIQQLKTRVSFDAVIDQRRKGMQTSLHLLVRDGNRKTLNKVCSINCQYYRDSDRTIHPIALAIQSGTDSRKVLALLEKLGFDFLDCPSILQEAIKASNQHLMYRITDRLEQVTGKWDHFSTHEALALPMRVLQKWRTLAYLQQPVKDASTALHEAVEAVDVDFVKFLINACRKAQTVELIGQLDWITFKKTKTSEVHHFHLNDIAPFMRLRAFCEEMIAAITDKKVFETSFTTLANVNSVFYIPFERETESMLSDRVFRLTSTLKNFTFDSVFPDCFNENSDTLLLVVIVKTETHTKCFLKVNDSFSVIFGITHCTEDDHAVSKLNAMVNFIDSHGSTPLHNCFPDEIEKMLQLKKILKTDDKKISGSKCTSNLIPSNTNEDTRKKIKNRCIVKEAKEILQLLCTEGANPLLMKNAISLAAIYFALQYYADRSIAFNLIDLCLKDDLRARSGANVLEFDDGDGNTLLHHAIMCDRPDVVKRLVELGTRVDTQNCASLTPAMMVLSGGLQNPSEMLKLLLDRDVGTLNARDPFNRTLLHYSVVRPSTKILPVLLSSVLDFRAKVEQNLTLFAAKDNQNLTPFQAALKAKHIDWLQRVLNFANDNQVPNVIGSDEELITIIAKREFDDIVEAAVKYCGVHLNDNGMSDEEFIIDFIAKNTNNRALMTYLKVVTVGH